MENNFSIFLNISEYMSVIYLLFTESSVLLSFYILEMLVVDVI